MKLTVKLKALAPPPRKYGESTLSMTGIMRPRSELAGRKPRAMKSSMRASQSLFPRWMVADTMASLSAWGTFRHQAKVQQRKLSCVWPFRDLDMPKIWLDSRLVGGHHVKGKIVHAHKVW